VAQQPVLTPETTATARPFVVRELFGVGTTYADLSTGQKEVVDKALDDAFMDVVNRAQWYALVNPAATDLPTQWNELFRATAVAKLKRSLRSPQDYHAHWTVYVEPLMERIEAHYTAAWVGADPLVSDAVTAVSVRQSVIARLVRQRTPVFMPVADIDREIRDEFVRLWSGRWWNFRKRLLKLTLNTDGSIVMATGDTVTSLASRHFVIGGEVGETSSQSARHLVVWVDATRAAELASAYEGRTGRPRWFYDTFVNGLNHIQLIPTPDVAYTAHAVVYIGPPQLAAGSLAADGLRQLPPPLRGHLRDRVVANIMSLAGREDTDAARMLAKVERDYGQYAGQFDDGGPSQSMATPHTTMRYPNSLMSSSGSGTLSPLG